MDSCRQQFIFNNCDDDVFDDELLSILLTTPCHASNHNIEVDNTQQLMSDISCIDTDNTPHNSPICTGNNTVECTECPEYPEYPEYSQYSEHTQIMYSAPYKNRNANTIWQDAGVPSIASLATIEKYLLNWAFTNNTLEIIDNKINKIRWIAGNSTNTYTCVASWTSFMKWIICCLKL